jgi:hypothetical protein
MPVDEAAHCKLIGGGRPPWNDTSGRYARSRPSQLKSGRLWCQTHVSGLFASDNCLNSPETTPKLSLSKSSLICVHAIALMHAAYQLAYGAFAIFAALLIVSLGFVVAWFAALRRNKLFREIVGLDEVSAPAAKR